MLTTTMMMMMVMTMMMMKIFKFIVFMNTVAMINPKEKQLCKNSVLQACDI